MIALISYGRQTSYAALELFLDLEDQSLNWNFFLRKFYGLIPAIICKEMALEEAMTIIQVELNEKAAKELDSLVRMGWFENRAEIVRLALTEFLGRNRLAIMEQFQEEDIRWALEQRKKPEDQP